MAETAAHAAQEKLATNIAAIDVSDVLAITEVFVLASADNERQVGSIVDEVEDEMTKQGFEPQRREGNRENRWVLLDYGNIVVHVQRNDQREFYGLDRLYHDCPALEIEGKAMRGLTGGYQVTIVNGVKGATHDADALWASHGW